MLVAHDQGRLVFWEVASGKEVKTLPGPRGELGYLYFSPDGKTLAVGRGDWRVSLWDWEAGKEREFPLPVHPRDVIEFSMDSTFHGSFSPDGKWFVAGASSREPLGVFEAATGLEVHRLTCHARTSAVSPDSKRLAVVSWKNDQGGRETVVRFFDLATGTEEAKFPLGHEYAFYTLSFSPDGKTLACGFSDQSCLLDCATGRILHRFPGRPLGTAFTADGKALVYSTGHRLHVWDVASRRERHDRPGEFGYSPVLAVSPDGRLLASGDWMEQVVCLWDAASGKLLQQLPLKGEKRYVRNVAFSADGRSLVACQYKGLLHFWDASTGRERRTVQLDDPAHPDKDFVYFYQFHVSPDLRHASTLERIFGQGREATRLVYWDAAVGKLLRQHTLPGEIRECAWSDDGLTVALSLSSGLTLAEVESGVHRFHLAGTSGGPAASPDDRLLAARRGGGAGVWEAATGKEVASVAAGKVAHLALTPDNRSLVATDEGFLRVWDLATGRERRRWALPEAGTNAWGRTFVASLLLSPDGRRAFTVLADGTALVWDLSPATQAVEPLVKAVGEKEFGAWWADLADRDAGRAYAAIWRLGEAPPGEVVAFLRRHLKPATDADFDKVRQLIRGLDSDEFEVREKAYRELEEAGSGAAPALRQALGQDPSPEVRRRLETLLARPPGLAASPESLRRLRAMQVLERAASPEARRLLDELARGVAHAPETQEAKSALARLSRRAAAP
jgi:WD40 repeat protein